MGIRASSLALCLGVLTLSGRAATGSSPGAPNPQASAAYGVGIGLDPAPPVRIGEILSLRLRVSVPSWDALTSCVPMAA